MNKSSVQATRKLQGMLRFQQTADEIHGMNKQRFLNLSNATTNGAIFITEVAIIPNELFVFLKKRFIFVKMSI